MNLAQPRKFRRLPSLHAMNSTSKERKTEPVGENVAEKFYKIESAEYSPNWCAFIATANYRSWKTHPDNVQTCEATSDQLPILDAADTTPIDEPLNVVARHAIANEIQTNDTTESLEATK